MTMGWICPVCGTAKSPQVESCCTAALPQQARQTTAAPAVAEKKASKATATPKRQRYSYTDEGFVQFWEVYPLKRGKAAAHRKWLAAVDAGVPQDRIIAAAAAYRDDPSRDPNFTKWPEGWLSAGRWDDDYTVAPPKPLVPVGPPIGSDEWQAQQDAEYERIKREMA